MVKWGNITEREGLEKLVDIIIKESESRPGHSVTPHDMQMPLRVVVKERNPRMSEGEVDDVASDIRVWLGSRYTMLDKVSDYVNMGKLLRFIRVFDRDGNPYSYRNRSRLKT